MEMGKLECKYCGATAEGKSFKEADDLIDHSIGLTRSNGCPGNPADLLWNGKPAFEISYKLLAKSEQPKAELSAPTPRVEPKVIVTKRPRSSK